MTYTVEILPSARRDLQALDPPVRRRIDEKILHLTKNPRPAGAKVLRGRELLRIRAGDYRVVYEIRQKRLVILIVRVGHRSRVYRGL